MNEIEAKLGSKNPVLIGQVIVRLMNAIEKNIKNDLKQIAEYKYLSDKCTVDCKGISVVASKAVVQLVERNILPLKVVMDDFISKIFGNGDLSGVIYVLHYLLLVEKSRNSKSSYDLIISSHPLVQVLERNGNYATVVLNHIKNCNSRNYDLCSPIYFYILNEPKIVDLTKQRLWTIILENESSDHVLDLLKWMQVSDTENLLETSEFLMQYLNCILKAERVSEALIVYTIAILSESIENDLNPLQIIDCVKRILEKNVLLYGQNCAVYLLSNCLTKTPAIYLDALLSLTLTVLHFGCFDALILESLKISVLPWLLYPCFVTENATKLANKILNLETKTVGSTNLLVTDEIFLKLKNSSSNLLIAVNLCVLSESWKNTEDIAEWLTEIANTPEVFHKTIFQFLLAVFMRNFEFCSVSVTCLHILTKTVKTFKTLANNLLILLLYKLPQTQDSVLHFEILKALPKFATREENVLLVRLTIDSLSKSSRCLYTFAMSLMFEMWKGDNRFYVHLEKFLAEPRELPDWEYYVTKSFILKEICSVRSELYGKDMVPHLSKILNECTLPEQETPCALAIEGIKQLCRFGIIDLITTWNTLVVIYQDETRPLVIQSICELLEEAPAISPKNEKYYKFIETVLTKLWEHVTMSNQVEVIGSALKALSCFNLEDISRYLPETYRIGEKPSDDLLFEKVSGLCWIKFLEYGNYAAIHEMGDFLISLVRVEISSYTKITYTVTQQQREPQNYNYLPQHSIVRAIGTYLQNEISTWKGVHKIVYLECLRVFSEEYSKPLPPLTWNFLQELVHEPEARHFCVSIACHQVMLSGSARRFIENFVVALTEIYTNDEDMLVIYKNLKHLCNSIQPVILRPFLEKSLNHILNSLTTSQHIFSEIVQYFKNVLATESIQETNKQVISELIANNVERVAENEEVFPVYMSCVLLLQENHIEQISSPKKYGNISLAQYKMCVKIRCTAIAESLSKVPLDLIKDFFFVSDNDSKKSVLLKEITLLLQNQKNKVVNSTWITDLLGQIQTTIAEEEKFSPHLELFFDVLVLSVVIFAGYNVFVKSFDMEKLRYLFPTAISTIVKTTYFNHQTLQILEWLHYIVRLEFLPQRYRIMTHESLISLRDEVDFRKNSRWKKYISTEFLFRR